MGRPAVAAIVGPTASGKSGVAMSRAAEDDRIEIVAVDAFTIYRGMDIGTAKPSVVDREAVRHHMIDVRDPNQSMTVADFQVEARAAIDDVLRRGGRPLLVGGSGLYFRAVVDPLEFPPTDPDVRAAIERRWADDPHAAHAHLSTTDPEAASRIGPDNLRRTVRALEVIELTGRAFSSYRTDWEAYDSIHDLAVTYLEPPTADLRAAIDRRARSMVADGLLDEAAALREAHPHGLSTTARQAIGYAEAFAVLDGELDLDLLAPTIAQRTWQYARRQRSWFRRDPRCVRGE